MSNYSWINAYFSPTGGTIKVARAITQGSGCPTNARSLPDAMLAAVEERLKQIASDPKQPELFL